MSYLEIIRTQKRRLTILRLLTEDPDYTSDTSELQSLLGILGKSVSYDQVITDMHWLRDAGTVTLENPINDLVTITLTQKGKDVADGLQVISGIARPSPKIKSALNSFNKTLMDNNGSD